MKRSRKRSGFTLVELLVTMSIIIILVLVTVTTLNWSASRERIPESARSIASFLEGARDRAIFSRKPTGVRLILDENGPTNSAGNPITCSSVIYVQQLDPIDITLSIVDDPKTPETDYRLLEIDDPQWNLMWSRGLLDERGVVMRLKDSGQEFRYVANYNGTDWLLTKDWFRAASDLKATVTISKPAVMSNQTPRELARGVVIDLETSRISERIPAGWYDTTQEEYIEEMDIMFGPDGIPSSDIGVLVLSMNLVVAEAADVEKTNWLSGSNPFYSLSSRPNATQERLVSVSLSTGKVGTALINLDDTNGDDIPDDPFFYAETGR